MSGKTEKDFDDSYEYRKYKRAMTELAMPLAPFYVNDIKGKFAVTVDPRPIKEMLAKEYKDEQVKGIA